MTSMKAARTSPGPGSRTSGTSASALTRYQPRKTSATEGTEPATVLPRPSQGPEREHPFPRRSRRRAFPRAFIRHPKPPRSPAIHRVLILDGLFEQGKWGRWLQRRLATASELCRSRIMPAPRPRSAALQTDSAVGIWVSPRRARHAALSGAQATLTEHNQFPRAPNSGSLRKERRSSRFRPLQWRLKHCTSRSCFSAAARDLKVPRLRRFPVFGSVL